MGGHHRSTSIRGWQQTRCFRCHHFRKQSDSGTGEIPPHGQRRLRSLKVQAVAAEPANKLPLTIRNCVKSVLATALWAQLRGTLTSRGRAVDHEIAFNAPPRRNHRLAQSCHFRSPHPPPCPRMVQPCFSAAVVGKHRQLEQRCKATSAPNRLQIHKVWAAPIYHIAPLSSWSTNQAHTMPLTGQVATSPPSASQTRTGRCVCVKTGKFR